MKGILLDDNGDLKVEDGSLVIGEIIRQNQKMLLLAQKGEIKERPLIGVGIADYLDDEDPANLIRVIRAEFAKEGMPVKKLEISNGKIEIDAEYSK